MMDDITKYQFIKKLQRLPFIEQIWLFGSRARNDYKEFDDSKVSLKKWFMAIYLANVFQKTNL